MPVKRKGRYNYSVIPFKYPSARQERRIRVPAIVRRPVRFQTRSLIEKQFLRPPDWRFSLHVRGPRGRPWIGTSPLEMRAIPKEQLRGTLPERIIYKYLTERMRFVDGVDFDFQSSLQGGRADTGGIVADFLFKILRVVINPIGPSHDEFIRMAKDREQTQALQLLGYDVYLIPEDDVYNESRFLDWMERIFGTRGSGGQGSFSLDESEYQDITNMVKEIK